MRTVLIHPQYGIGILDGEAEIFRAGSTMMVGANWTIYGYGTQYANLPASECYLILV